MIKKKHQEAKQAIRHKILFLLKIFQVIHVLFVQYDNSKKKL